jgi:glycosyltransferase involved in cell wall biosynthesis
VATDVGDVRERLQGVSPSKVVNNRDPEDFGQALAEVLMQRIRCNGREQADSYDEAQVANAVRATYEEALGWQAVNSKAA